MGEFLSNAQKYYKIGKNLSKIGRGVHTMIGHYHSYINPDEALILP